MTTRQTSKIMHSLRKKGFVDDHTDHHERVAYQTIGAQKKTLIRTHVSPTKKDVSAKVFGAMAKQCKLSNEEFTRLVDCPMSRDDYERLLTARGHLS